ncbi:hypothetical protein ADN00_12910 [Ornatilinea apprima]|uniref:Uncharacterized protein n=1 Tax=Ornatilinea apprima TaxID=1134406 RepID=A0A0P6X7Y5_9CHLR|nr:hypothetical protein [Ornatilinea apprima]KPL75536.1 hypothetical protein ADN00_12910 [Ornatilinea apprima]
MIESVELSFEIAKLLAHNGYPSDAPAFTVTWGQIAEAVAQTVLAHNLPTGQLTEETVLILADKIQRDLKELDPLNSRGIVLDRVMPPLCSSREVTSREINPALWEPEFEPDEGPLAEMYENATRLGDDEAYWVDAGASAGFDDF